MIQLIINADDLGLHPRIDAGILEAAAHGALTSSTVLVTGPTARFAVEKAAKLGVGLGVHLCLTTHLEPAADPLQVRWLAPGGRFRANWATFSAAFVSSVIPLEEIELEFRAQIEKLEGLGASPDHLDTHQHLHLFPSIMELVERLAVERGIPVRWPAESPDARWLRHPRSAAKTAVLLGLSRMQRQSTARRVPAIGVFDSGRLNTRRLVRLLKSLPEGEPTELACHPGHDPGFVPHDPLWRYDWEGELRALTSPEAADVIRGRNIELISYGALGAAGATVAS